MAELSRDPRGYELEDFVAAHLSSRSVFLECSVTHRDPIDVLEFDVVWTDLRERPAPRIPIEVKSGDWGLGDIFKFYGWSRFLQIDRGIFFCRSVPSRTGLETILRLCSALNIDFIHVEAIEDAGQSLDRLGLGAPIREYLPKLWRYSYWLGRRLDRSLSTSIGNGRMPTVGRAAKDYAKLVNDAAFFERDPRARIYLLTQAHWKHPKLGLSAAREIEGLDPDFSDPAQCRAFNRALYYGENYPVQACLNLGHKARLAILKAGVDYLDARESGEIQEPLVRFFTTEFSEEYVRLNRGFIEAIEGLAVNEQFRRYPIFWQIFLYCFGGFLLTDRLDVEYGELSQLSGVPVEEIDEALSCFDRLFPIPGGWFRNPNNDVRRVVTLTPAVYRGLGAFHRLKLYGREHYGDLELVGRTGHRMTADHNAAVDLLDGGDGALLR